MSLLSSIDSPPATTVPLGRTLVRWIVAFAGFPLGGLAAVTLVGPVDSVGAALLGGLLTGLVLGAVQAWALRLRWRAGGWWAVATAAGLALGLTVGASVVGFGTGLADLVLQGALCGAAVGVAQAVLLRHRVGRLALVWPALLAAAWAVGWAVTTVIGVAVDQQFTVFGSAGAVTVTALTAVLPVVLRARAAGIGTDAR